jgi:hypothetical protein
MTPVTSVVTGDQKQSDGRDAFGAQEDGPAATRVTGP